MIKFKVGDKVKCVEHVDFFTNNCGKGCGIVSCFSATGGFIDIDGCDIHWNAGMFELDSDEWAVYNNAKPLSELSDEQAAKLFNYLRSNGSILAGTQDVTGFGIVTYMGNPDCIYRAKQKSERELFIDASRKALGIDQDDDAAEALFNAGFKAPKVGE